MDRHKLFEVALLVIGPPPESPLHNSPLPKAVPPEEWVEYFIWRHKFLSFADRCYVFAPGQSISLVAEYRRWWLARMREVSTE